MWISSDYECSYYDFVCSRCHLMTFASNELQQMQIYGLTYYLEQKKFKAHSHNSYPSQVSMYSN